MNDDFMNSFKAAFPDAQVTDEPIDWDSVESEGRGFDPLPEGNYNMTVSKAELRQSLKGAMQISLTYDVEGTKRKVFDTLTYKDNPGYVPGPKGIFPSKIGLGRIKTLLTIGGKDLGAFKYSECYQLVGIKFNGKLKIDLYNPEKPKNKVSSIGAYVEPKVKAEVF
jgi:hypothetical protein